MHELPLVREILRFAIAAAPHGARVTRLEVGIGAFCDADVRWLERYFRLVSKGGPCENATLSVTKLPASFRCTACDLDFSASLDLARLRTRLRRGKPPARCPSCGSEELKLEGCLEYRLERIEVMEALPDGGREQSGQASGADAKAADRQAP